MTSPKFRPARRLMQGVLVLLCLCILAIAPFAWFSVASAGAIKCGNGSAPTMAMPIKGDNFASYCEPCIAALRTFARVEAIETLTATFERLSESHPKTRFLYGEMGFPNGGRFRPHRTHREGLSIDIMVPLKGGKVMGTSVTNRYGYDVEFNSKGHGAEGRIDFDALGALFLAADAEARKRGGKIRRVFFAPDLQPLLFSASPKALKSIAFNKRQAWVRHDDHIHIDFEFPCPNSN